MVGSLVISHSDKDLTARPQGTFDHYLLMATCGNTGESLALLLRKGSAGSTTADHITVLDEAIAQIPAKHR